MRKFRKQCLGCREYIHKYDYDLCMISGKMSWRQTKQKCKDYQSFEKEQANE